MKEIITAFTIALLTYALGLLTCGLVGVIILIVKKIVSNREEGTGQT